MTVVANLVKNYAPHIKPDVESAPPTAELRRILSMTARDMLASYLRKYRTRRLLARPGSQVQNPAVNAVKFLCLVCHSRLVLIVILTGR